MIRKLLSMGFLGTVIYILGFFILLAVNPWIAFGVLLMVIGLTWKEL